VIAFSCVRSRRRWPAWRPADTCCITVAKPVLRAGQSMKKTRGVGAALASRTPWRQAAASPARIQPAGSAELAATSDFRVMRGSSERRMIEQILEIAASFGRAMR
jgi:hypothetical protein